MFTEVDSHFHIFCTTKETLKLFIESFELKFRKATAGNLLRINSREETRQLVSHATLVFAPSLLKFIIQSNSLTTFSHINNVDAC